ncbi:hypothetical protein THAOC_37296 [Thalassiosira oceanica]|uniref:Uncharacterized protein n=1 Tax=Thalassiosira oceanica TaxID=159749 RepID=K0QYL2_THAOC|nr:hypothetical protein THAOC_37296 [Thalassiosira oceanica]|eukprot:EJK44188.1 hypothetical protein THAOC_37296 [Thalassiosira oceanica]
MSSLAREEPWLAFCMLKSLNMGLTSSKTLNSLPGYVARLALHDVEAGVLELHELAPVKVVDVSGLLFDLQPSTCSCLDGETVIHPSSGNGPGGGLEKWTQKDQRWTFSKRTAA